MPPFCERVKKERRPGEGECGASGRMVPRGTAQGRQIREVVGPDRWLTLGFKEVVEVMEWRTRLSIIPIHWESAQRGVIGE